LGKVEKDSEEGAVVVVEKETSDGERCEERGQTAEEGKRRKEGAKPPRQNGVDLYSLAALALAAIAPICGVWLACRDGVAKTLTKMA
jgi:hypothetical protein